MPIIARVNPKGTLRRIVDMWRTYVLVFEIDLTEVSSVNLVVFHLVVEQEICTQALRLQHKHSTNYNTVYTALRNLLGAGSTSPE